MSQPIPSTAVVQKNNAPSANSKRLVLASCSCLCLLFIILLGGGVYGAVYLDDHKIIFWAVFTVVTLIFIISTLLMLFKANPSPLSVLLNF